MSVTHVSKKFALTVPKIKKLFVEHELLGTDNKPAVMAFEKGLTESRTGFDKYGDGGEIELIVWNIAGLEALPGVFQKPDEVAAFYHVKNCNRLEQKLCKAILLAGQELGYSHAMSSDAKLSAWRLSMGLSEDTAYAIEQCEFNDPDFLGGPFFCAMLTSKTEALEVIAALEPVVRDFEAALRHRLPARADFLRAVTTNLTAWMLNSVK